MEGQVGLEIERKGRQEKERGEGVKQKRGMEKKDPE